MNKPLSPSLAEVLHHLSQNKSLNTVELHELGINSPAHCIAKLKAKGAIIEKTTRTVTSNSGREHKRIACYRLIGCE